MRAQYKTAGGRMTVEIEGESPKVLFEKLAKVQEIFDNTTCGACQSTNTRFRVRERGGYTYYEIACQACRAVLAFGQNQDMKNLFPQLKDKEGNWYEAGGWKVWKPSNDGS